MGFFLFLFYMTRILITILTTLSFTAFGQYKWDDLDNIIKKGNTKILVTHNYKLLEQGFYYQAYLISERLLEKDSTNFNYLFRHGFALINMTPNYDRALPYLQKSADSINPNFDFLNYREVAAPIDAYYQLGYCYHLKGELEKARKYYNLFLTLEKKDTPAYKTTELNLKQLDNAVDAINHKSRVHLEGVGTNINTDNPEYSSIVSYDGRSLYYTSRRLRSDASDPIIDPITGYFLEDIFVSHKQLDGSWSKPEMLEVSRPTQNEATVAISLNKKTVYLYDDSEGNGDLFYAPIEDNNPFSRIKHLDIPNVNTEFWEPHIAFTGDGNVAYFSSNRPGGFGGRDIYRIVRYGNGEWSEPINMGPDINTEWDEDSPFISVDGKTMYYASNGVRSIGGFDIFLTVLDEDNNWSYPINLGYPINSTGDDLYYTTTVDGKVAYITSFREQGQGEKDIYRIIYDNYIPNNNLFVNGNLKTLDDKPDPEGVLISLQCFDCGSDYTIQDMKSTYVDGKYLVELEPNKEYDVIFVDTKTGNIKKQSIITNDDGNNPNNKVGIMLDPENLEIVQEELSPNFVRLKLIPGSNTRVPDNVTVNISCLDCETTDDVVDRALNSRNQALIEQSPGHRYAYTFKDENGNILLNEERTSAADSNNIKDEDYIFIYNPKDIENITIDNEISTYLAGIRLEGVTEESPYYNEQLLVQIICLDCNEEEQKKIIKLNGENRTKTLLLPGKTYQYQFRSEDGRILLSETRTNPITIDFGNNDEQVFNYSGGADAEVVYCPLAFAHNYYYNNNGLNSSNPYFMRYLDSIKTQLNNGRAYVNIVINSSASYVPTRSFENNQELAEVRAQRVKEFLSTYYKQYLNEGRIDITIESSKVQGPAYDRKDLRNLEKYAPFQYVTLYVEGENCTEGTNFASIDPKLKEFNAGSVKPAASTLPEFENAVQENAQATDVEAAGGKNVSEGIARTEVSQPVSNIYYVIVYTFKIEANAITILETEFGDVETAKIVQDEKGYYLVSLDEFESLTNAKRYVEIYNIENNAHAYLYRKK